MSLTEKDIRHIAKLSALAVEDNEIETLKRELGSILEYVTTLSQINTRGVEPTSHIHGVVNAFRDDVVKENLTNEEALKNAPDASRGSFRVPRII